MFHTQAPPQLARLARSRDGRTNILVSLVDSDHFRVVQIAGFTNAALVKELIFAKLQIPNEDTHRYSIHQTDGIDTHPTTRGLSDDELYKLCVQKGDTKGSVRFLVSTNTQGA